MMSVSGNQAEARVKRWNIPLTIAGCAVILFNFFWFNRNIIRFRFAPDEMMNMGWAWEAGLSKIVKAILAFWTQLYRPTGALYYWLLHHFFGLNPLPFRVVDLAFLLVNVGLAYGVMHRLTRSAYVAWLGAFIFSYHTGISIWSNYNGAFAYDRLCFTFYFLALFVYLGLREKRDEFGIGVFVLVVASYVLAIGAKEIAVTLPPMLVLYELIYHSDIFWPFWRRESLFTFGRIAILAAITSIFVFVKILGPNSFLAQYPAYAPTDISVAHFLRSQAGYLSELIFRPQNQAHPNALLIFCLMFAVSIAFRSKTGLFSTLWAAITALPLVFIDRGGGCLYIVYFGWALFAAVTLQQFASFVAGLMPKIPGLRGAILTVLAAPLLFLLFSKNTKYQNYWETPARAVGDATWSAITELNRIQPRLSGGSSVAYLHTSIEGWDLKFITELWCRDPSVAIYLNQQTPLSKEQVGQMSVILDFDKSGRLHQLTPADVTREMN
jgi:hypothetical protein